MNQPEQGGSWVIGTGCLGSRVDELLRQQGEQVLTVDAAAPADIMGDAVEEETLRRALGRVQPRVVYCCQSTHGGEAEDYRRCYRELVRQVIALVPSTRIVFCSSASVYGKRDGALTGEESPCCPASERGKILLQTEQLVQQAGGVVARLAPLYAEGRCEILRRHLAGEPQVPGTPSRMLNYLHREDAAKALLLLGRMVQLPWTLFNVCSESFSKEQVYTLMSRLTGVPPALTSAPPSQRGTSDVLLDCRRLRSLGWSPGESFASFVARTASR